MSKMMKLFLVSMCLAFVLVGGQQQFSCSFDDNLLISNGTSIKTRGHKHGNSLNNWGKKKAEVPYFFAEGIPDADKALVRQEMQRISNHVPCITFHEKSQKDVPRHHLEIQVGTELGCYQVGPGKYKVGFSGEVDSRGYHGEKVIFNSAWRLANTAFCAEQPMITGGVLHELMHALGIAHTQKRFDSKKHIEVKEECIIPDNDGSNLAQFERTKKGTLNTYGVPYKCNSIMHYKVDQFSIDKKNCKTIVPISKSCIRTGVGSNVAIEEDWQLLKEAHCKR